MSAPQAVADSHRKSHKHRGARRRNAATSNPPKPEQQQAKAAPAALAPKLSQASQLLAQLAAAQGPQAPPIPKAAAAAAASTSKMSTPKQKEYNNKGQKAKSEAGSKHGSVGARMRQQQHPPPLIPSSSTQRYRTTSQSYGAKSNGPKIPEDVLDSISFRFIMNIPDSERLDETRVCFQIELAHWFYIDFYVNQEERADCLNIGMRDFLKQIIVHNDFLKSMAYRSDEILDNWRNYKSTVPTYGGMLLDSTLNHILLVQGFYASKNSWGFPKGKVNESESPRECAVREVREETGFDFGEHSPGKEFKIQKMVNDTMIRLYVVKDVPMDYKFEPQTRCEIRKMKWFNIWDLPTDRNDQFAANKGFQPKHFYGVVPFVQDLHNYVKREEKRREKESKTRKEKGGGGGTTTVTPSSLNLSGGNKKSSAFTKVEKKSPSERAWMEAAAAASGSSSDHQKSCGGGGVTTTPASRAAAATAPQIRFKPLGETGGAPPGSNLAMILAHSSASWSGGSSSGTSSKTPVAHPVAIRPCDHPVYEASAKEEKCKVAPSLISSNVWQTPVLGGSIGGGTGGGGTSTSASAIEDALNKILFNAPLSVITPTAAVAAPLPSSSTIDSSCLTPIQSHHHPHQQRHPDPYHHHHQRDSSIDGDEEVKECVPALSQDPVLPPMGDICLPSDLLMMGGGGGGLYFSPNQMMLDHHLPSTSSRSHSIPSSTFRRNSAASSILSPTMKAGMANCSFELVPAWKSFKLNRDVIFEEISRFM